MATATITKKANGKNGTNGADKPADKPNGKSKGQSLRELLETVPKVGQTTADQALREADLDGDAKPIKGQLQRAGRVDTEKAGLSGKARALWVLTGDSAGNDAAKSKAADAKKEATVTATKTADAFVWPKEGAVKILLRYLKENTSDAPDAPNKGLPFVTDSGIIRIKPDHWRDWLTENGLAPTKLEAGRPIRELGFSMKPFPIPGTGHGAGFYTGNVSQLEGADKLPVRQTQRGPGRPKNPFTGMSDQHRGVIVAALTAFKPNKRTDDGKAQSEAKDELLALVS